MSSLHLVKIHLFLILFLWGDSCKGQIAVVLKWHHQVYNDIFVIKHADTTNLTKFASWESILEFTISPDSNYCFVRHKPEKGKKAYLLTLYDLKTLQKTHQIIPGYGDKFDWNENLQIIHSWGCGTNCANLVVYNLQLKDIFFTLSTGGFKFSPGNNFIVQFNMQGNEIRIFDLKSLSNNLTPKVHHAKIETEYEWDEFLFINEHEIIIKKAGTVTPSKIINLKRVMWGEFDPEKTGGIRNGA